MFYEQRMTVPDSPEELAAEYAADLSSILEDANLEDAAAETGIERERLAAVLSDEPSELAPELTLEETSEIQALGEGEPDAETIETMACEHLLLGMSVAVLDVEAVEGDLEIDLDAKEIQQKIERRAPMSLEEFAHVQHVIVDRAP